MIPKTRPGASMLRTARGILEEHKILVLPAGWDERYVRDELRKVYAKSHKLNMHWQFNLGLAMPGDLETGWPTRVYVIRLEQL